MINLNLGDCMEAMSKMEDNAYDLAIDDPPYGIGDKKLTQGGTWASKYKNDDAKWDVKPPYEYFIELFRVSKNQIVWGGNYMTDKLHPSPCWLIWDKMQEFKGAVFEMAWTSFKSPAKAFRMSRVEAYANKNKIHITQKPVALYKWLLKNYAKEGDKILDTHLGSGSIAIACHDGGFALDAWEIDAEYHKAATERFNTHIKQLRLL